VTAAVVRVGLIHALAHSVDPVNLELARRWPGCQRMNLLDDSLSEDLARAGGLDARMTARFLSLADYAVGCGANGLLFTCSAFGPCIDAVARRHAAIPVLKPNEAMIDEAVARGARIGLVASFAPTLASMPAEFPAGTDLRTRLAIGALDALDRGDHAGHDAAVAAAAEALVRVEACTVVVLAQFSMARARELVASRTGAPVLTTVESAVRRLRERLEV